MFQEDLTLWSLYRDFFFIFILFIPIVFLFLAILISQIRKKPKGIEDVMVNYFSKDLFSEAPRNLMIAFFITLILGPAFLFLAPEVPEIFPEQPLRIEYTVLSPERGLSRVDAWPAEYFVFENGTTSYLKTPTMVIENWVSDDPKIKFLNNSSETFFLYAVIYRVDNRFRSPKNLIAQISPYSFVEICCQPVSVGLLPEEWLLFNETETTVYHLSPALLHE